MKHLPHLLALALAACTALASAPAQALSFTGHSFAEPSANNAVSAFGSDLAQSFDIGFGRFTSATLNFSTMRDEAAPVMSFSALIGNFSGFNLPGLRVQLSGGAVFAAPAGTVTGSFGVAGTPSVTPTLVSVTMLAAEPFQLSFGNPLSQAGEADWAIDFSAVQAGGSFAVTVTAVPEPAAALLLLAGLGALGAWQRRKPR